VAKRGKGQPTKLTPERQRAIIDALRAGCYKATAAEYAGIGVSTLHRWLETGEADDESGRQSDYRDFWEAVKKADAEFQMRALLQIDQAARDGSWQAAAWRLERKYPQLWGRKQRVEEESAKAETQRTTVYLVPEEEQRVEVARILAEAYGDGPWPWDTDAAEGRDRLS
jgi:transposase